MLYEVAHVRRNPDEARRRWFTDAAMDLIVWVDEADRILGFQLCYDRRRSHRAISWFAEKGYMHHRVDSGEKRPGRPKSTPLMAVDGPFPRNQVADAFRQRGACLPEGMAEFIGQKITAYTGGTADATSNGTAETEGAP